MTTVPAQGDLPPLPCPFCGDADIQFDATDERTRLRCHGCGVEGGLFFFSLEECETGDSKEAEACAVEAWNKRAAPAPEPQKKRATIDQLITMRGLLEEICQHYYEGGLEAGAAGRQDASEPVAPDDERDDARDAARYRWLRATDEVESVMVGATIYGEEFRSGADLDAAIDAAIASMPESPKAGE